jgi:phosphoribosylanthranilate isomerase
MKIKICGLTSKKEAEYLNSNQVDFAGMVLFFSKSKRNITIEQAKEIMSALNKGIQKVAVVVEPSLEQIQEIEQAGFDYIQIHGKLQESLLEQVKLPVLKAFNIKDMNEYETYHKNPKIAGYVFDAQEPGSGKTFDWSLVKNIPRDEKMLLLAGGLHPGNVQEAINYLNPDGVDVSSGVEYEDKLGKDEEKIKLFVEQVKTV